MGEVQPTSRYCFLCGRDNPVGLHMRWESDPQAHEVRGTVTVPEPFNGYPGVVHGGIVAALLDKTAGRALLVSGNFDDLMVTAKLEVVYRRPTPTGVPLTVVGRVLSRSERRAHAQAELVLPNGSVSARAEVTLARPPAALAATWEAERPYWKVDGKP